MDTGAAAPWYATRARRAGSVLATVAAAGAGWGWFEAGWVRLRELELGLPGLPSELDGLRIAHLSDFHLGVPSRGVHAVERAVEWAAERKPDLVAITGDLLTHPRGEPRLRELVGRLPLPAVAVLGNHDVAISRDPQARASNLRELEPATLLSDGGVLLELRGKSVWIAGTHPRLIVRDETKLDPNTLARDADLRILLCHYPRVFDRVEPGKFDLVLTGHMHDGQIAVPYPGGKLRLAHPGARYQRGVYRSAAGVMHVSPGLGTTFVPFRFAARPEATELLLRSGRDG
ncbi:MAG: metallophosphoesterase [Gaiellaceae bacterium]